VHNVSDVRQIEVLTAKQLIPCPGRFQVENAIAKLKKYKLPGSDQIHSHRVWGTHETS
jgi:hypothetical protein